MVAIKYWYCSWHGYKKTIYRDNEAVCHVINSGKNKDSVLLNCIREITYVACINEFQIRAVHLPYYLNLKISGDLCLICFEIYLTETSFCIFTARRGVSILKQEVRQSQRAAYLKGRSKTLRHK